MTRNVNFVSIANSLAINLVEVHSYSLNEQQSHCRATHVAIIPYDVGRFDPKIFVNCSTSEI